MQLRLCMFGRGRRQWKSQCGFGASFVHIEVSAAGEAESHYLCSALVPCTFCEKTVRTYYKKLSVQVCADRGPGGDARALFAECDYRYTLSHTPGRTARVRGGSRGLLPTPPRQGGRAPWRRPAEEGDMDLRLCMSQRRRRFGVAVVYV